MYKILDVYHDKPYSNFKCIKHLNVDISLFCKYFSIERLRKLFSQ
jgi:hypothetical protein